MWPWLIVTILLSIKLLIEFSFIYLYMNVDESNFHDMILIYLLDNSFVCHDLEAHSLSVVDSDFVRDDSHCHVYHVDAIHHLVRDSLGHDLNLCRDSSGRHVHHDNHYDLAVLDRYYYLLHYCLHYYDF